jgi:hypothetical protein
MRRSAPIKLGARLSRERGDGLGDAGLRDRKIELQPIEQIHAFTAESPMPAAEPPTARESNA